MNPFRRAIQKLEKATGLNPNDLFLEAVGKHEEELIIHLNTRGEPTSQLFVDGINSLGETLESIGGGYSDVTIEIKKEKGQPIDRVTLLDTGKFYDSFKITRTKDSLIIEADPIKDQTNLFDEWGRDILGITDENKAILNERLIPKIKKIIFKEFCEA